MVPPSADTFGVRDDHAHTLRRARSARSADTCALHRSLQPQQKHAGSIRSIRVPERRGQVRLLHASEMPRREVHHAADHEPEPGIEEEPDTGAHEERDGTVERMAYHRK